MWYISLVYVIICLDCSKGSSKSSTSYRGWILLAVYVCEFALGEGEVAEVALFTGWCGGPGLCLMFIFAFVLAVLIAAKEAGCTDGAGALLMTDFC